MLKKIIGPFIHWHTNIPNDKVSTIYAMFSPSNKDEFGDKRFEGILKNISDDFLRELIESDKKNITSLEKGGYEIEYQAFSHSLSKQVNRKINWIYQKVPLDSRCQLTINLASYSTVLNKEIINTPGFRLLFCYNPVFLTWENKKYLSYYKYTKGLEIYLNPMSNEKMVDISNRPGKYSHLEGGYFMGAHEYYFGPAIFHLFPRELLLEFKYGEVVEELDNGVIHIKLFDHMDYWKPISRDILSAFRKHLHIDELAAEYENKLRKK